MAKGRDGKLVAFAGSEVADVDVRRQDWIGIVACVQVRQELLPLPEAERAGNDV